jgi:hypothetical protein
MGSGQVQFLELFFSSKVPNIDNFCFFLIAVKGYGFGGILALLLDGDN